MTPASHDTNSIRYRPGTMGGMTVAHLRITDFRFERHSHAEYAVGFTRRGVQTFNCRGTRQQSTPGHVILMNPDVMHDGLPGDGAGYEYGMLYVEEGALHELLERSAGTAAGAHFRDVIVHDPAAAGALRSALAAAGGPQETLRGDVLAVQALVGLVLRHGEQPNAGGTPVRSGEHRMRRVREYIEAHAARDLSLADLAAEAGVSRVYLSRAFARHVGVPPHIYLNAVRLRRARASLLRGHTLADTAAATGFSDQSHFTRRFKGAMGLTPGEWLRQVRPASPSLDTGASS